MFVSHNKLWNIVSTERYTLHMHVCKNVALYKWKVQSEADLAITVASFISHYLLWIRADQSLVFE
jgi:hypothetical protein